MELLCGVPKIPKNVKYDNWGTWGKMGFAPHSTDSYNNGRSSTMPSKLTANIKKPRRVSAFHLQQHILPTEGAEQCTAKNNDPYSNLFNIPENEASAEVLVDVPRKSKSVAYLPFRRTKTLPPSAIRRSAENTRSKDGGAHLLTENDASKSSSEYYSSLRPLKNRLRFESLRRTSKSGKNSGYCSTGDSQRFSETIYTIPGTLVKNSRKVECSQDINGAELSVKSYKAEASDCIAALPVSSKLSFASEEHTSTECKAVITDPYVTTDRNTLKKINKFGFFSDGRSHYQTPRIAPPVSASTSNGPMHYKSTNCFGLSSDNSTYSHYQRPISGFVERNGLMEVKSLDSNFSGTDILDNHISCFKNMNGKSSLTNEIDLNPSNIHVDQKFSDISKQITEDLLLDIVKMDGFPSKELEDRFSDAISEISSSIPYSEPATSDQSSMKEESCSEGGERNSISSMASAISQLTIGNTTDEGIGSIYSETYGSLWSSSASSVASTCSTRCAGKYNDYPTTDEGMSIYSSMSCSSYSSSVGDGNGMLKPGRLCPQTGAIPKLRSLSLRRHSERDFAKGRCVCDIRRKFSSSSSDDVSSDTETCASCKKEGIDEASMFKRTGSLRAPKQLPVTPTLLKLLQLGLEQVGNESNSSIEADGNLGVSKPTNNGVVRREKLHPPRTDPHRLSRANLEESGDLELDAILSELCALGDKFNFELNSLSSAPLQPCPSSQTNSHLSNAPSSPQELNMPSQTICNSTNIHSKNLHKVETSVNVSKFDTENLTSNGLKPKYEAVNGDTETSNPSTIVSRTDSPDNDSAFSDNVSMLSSESSASSGASAGGGTSSKQDPNKQADLAAKVKAEKIKMALEKLKEANVKKLFIKVFGLDGSSKSLLVDEKMSVMRVCRMLMDKNHVKPDPKWALVEHLPDLYMERIYEDDEMLVDNLLLWTRESKNRLLFLERPDKYDLFLTPENYLLYGSSLHKSSDVDDEARNNLLEEFFSSSRVPEVEGPLFLKSEGKKAWKKFYFILRQSGLYYCPKGKSSRSSKDLVCLATLESNQVYHGVGWKKKFKAPTDLGFAIKLSSLQAKSSKHIKYLSCENAESLSQWVMGIRIAKNGHRMLENYRTLVEEIVQEDIDLLASSRSFSLASVSASSRGTSEATTPSSVSESRSLDSCLAPSLREEDMDDASTGSSSQDTPVNTLCRAPIRVGACTTANLWRPPCNHERTLRSASPSSSSSSSGCLSERSSSTGTPSVEGGFEADFPPQGTIKRKPPSQQPKLPLTTTTRHLVQEADRHEGDSPSRGGSLRRSVRKTISEEVATLRRRNDSTSTMGGRISVSSTSSSKVEDELTDAGHQLPLPHPDESCNPDLLPPPPPELLSSTLSLNSFPPPPDEAAIASLTSDIDPMTASITSLPPPPPPETPPKPLTSVIKTFSPPATPPKPKFLFSPQMPPKHPRMESHSPVYASRVSFSSPLEQPSSSTYVSNRVSSPTENQPFLSTSRRPSQEALSDQPLYLPRNGLTDVNHQTVDSIYAVRNIYQPSIPEPRSPTSVARVVSVPPALPSPTKVLPMSPPKRVKKITFREDVQSFPISPCPSPPAIKSPSKNPPLPKRSPSTKLSVPGKLDAPGCKVTPPKSFLNNLQRVMQKKWQVAQKCRDFDKTPHEVLGFRDPVPQKETERNVGAWIQEHYGSLYENLAPSSDNERIPPAEPVPNGYYAKPVLQPQVSCTYSSDSLQRGPSIRKKPPPPPPKRAETTHLTTKS